MAQKRMFDKKVVCSDKFIDLPNSSKSLYFMAGMEADDKGFFQPRKLQRMCGFSDDDYKILIAKGFFITFESGVMVVTDWNKNNWLDSRRITETEYVDELNLLKLVNQKYEFKLENDTAKPTLSQYSIEENSIEYNNSSSIYDFLQENGFVLSPIHYEIVREWEDNELTRHAIKQAVMNNKYNIKYVQSILNSYEKDNIKTIQQALEREEQFNKSKKTSGNKNQEVIPEWFDKKQDKENITKEEQKEMEELLNSF